MTYPSIIDQQPPLYLRDVTQGEVFHFGQRCAPSAADDRPLPVTRCRYVNDVVTARIHASTEVASVSA